MHIVLAITPSSESFIRGWWWKGGTISDLFIKYDKTTFSLKILAKLQHF